METMNFRILIADEIREEGIGLLARRPGFQVDVKTNLSPDELLEVAGNYHGLVVRSATKVTADVIRAAPHLKIVTRAGAGLDNIDVPEATRHGILVMNTPGGNSVATAEHTISLIMALHRHIPLAVDSLKSGKWDKTKFQGREMAGRTLGIIGLGRVGSIVSRLADRGLNMKVLGYDPVISQESASRMGVQLVALDDIFSRSDVITVHVPLNNETRNIIDARALGMMQTGVMVVNCARGGVIDEDALLEALESGKVAAAALDVYSVSPPGMHPLVLHPRVIATPHLGASTIEAQINVAVAAAEQIIAYLEEGVVSNAVNVPSVGASEVRRMQPYMELARKLGRLLSWLAPGPITEMEVEYRGEIATWDLKPITNAGLAGLLSCFEGEEVNDVNAAAIAQERGITVSETTVKADDERTSALAVRSQCADGSSHTVTGALFRRRGNEPRIIGINNFVTEAIPVGPMLIVTNRDVPGMIAGIAGTLAERRINIAQMNLSRESVGGTALSIINLDDTADEATLQRIRDIEGIVSVRQVILD